MSENIVLIVDDQPENLQSIADVFNEDCTECNIVKAPNGKTALRIMEKIIPDIIITDWEMPEMDGIEFIKKIKQNPLTEDIPIIMCTGVMTTSENLYTALEAGAVDYIRKPIDRIELLARTKANLNLADSYNRIKALNQAKDNILAIISHDLRSPVGNIKNFVDLIITNHQEFDNSQLLTMIETIGKQSASVFTILDNLLIWANNQRNNITINPVLQDLNKVINQNIDLLLDSAVNKQISIQNKIKTDLQANFDTSLISTVIRNLLANAIKFTPKNGKIDIYCKEDNNKIFICVKDSGIGIEEERISKIFNLTHHETTPGTNSEKGSGLGLKLCYDLVNKHGGEIWVESKFGEGSEFIFTIPNMV